ncbi:MAG: DUF3866 family protein [Firmicutes bacterium]|nr:DUF3866 family protein [Bacillota bacterium]
MFSSKLGTVVRMIRDLPTYQELAVQLDGSEAKDVAYPPLTGAVRVGDRVWLNTTAVELNLGTGGFHFVQAIEGRREREYTPPGHIMKLRYTPWQVAVAAAEEAGSAMHEQIKGFTSLAGTPVVVGTLHSMIAPAVLAFHAVLPGRRVAYLMTDGAALPLSFSDLVRQLKDRGLLARTITAGHAFGGDLETVNVYSGLVAAKTVVAADLVIIAMGPGIVGTGTKYGFSGIEQAYILEAVAKLGGYPIAIPRISFADPRSRHWGLSHHTQTVLGELTATPVAIGLPRWDEEKRRVLTRQFRESGVSKHRLYAVEIPEVASLLSAHQLAVKTMGRTVREDPAFFEAAAGAGVLAAVHLGGGVENLPAWLGNE